MNKIISVINSLDKRQLGRLREYVKSPYFRVQPAAAELFNYLFEFYPDYNDENFNFECVAKKTSLKTLKQQKNAYCRLLIVIHDFIGLSQWEKKEHNKFIPKIEGLRELELHDCAFAEHQRAMEYVNENSDKGIDLFYLRQELEQHEVFNFNNRLKRNSKNKNISVLIETMEETYALNVLKIACSTISNKQIFGSKPSSISVERAREILSPLCTPKYPYVWIYMNAYSLLTAPTFEEGQQAFFRLEYIIKKQQPNGFTQDLLNAIQFNINWSLQWMAKGKREAAEHYLYWIDYKAFHNLILERNQILPIAFRNPIIAAVDGGLRPAEKISAFIRKYAPHLPHGVLAINETFANAMLNYYRGDYDAAAVLFQSIAAKGEPVFNAIIRRWQFINLYESQKASITTLNSMLDSFERFIQRNKEELPMRTIFSKFISYSKYILFPDEYNPEFVASKLASENFFPGKHWISKQLHLKTIASQECA